MRSVKGTRDLLPPETGLWARVEAVAREVFALYGYSEIRTPLLEPTELFVRTVGETTDIVGKEMYTFDDRKGRSLTLRPESTAAVGRAFVQHGLGELPLPVKLYYIGPHFRYERPQKGRYRQFHQIGAELIGDAGPVSDAELVGMLVRFLSKLGFRDLTVLVHTVGDDDSRATYSAALRDYLRPHVGTLGEDSRRRLEQNPLRILDTKVPAERDLLENAPRLAQFLTAESKRHFHDFKTVLDGIGVAHRTDERLVRGLDYYTRTVFEIVSEGLGAQDAIVGGGRYDGLVRGLGGSDLPGVGFAIGQDRLIEALADKFKARQTSRACVAVVPIEPVAVGSGLELAEGLRDSGIPATVEFSTGRVGHALRKADRSGIRYVVLLGEDEIEKQGVTLKDLQTGDQRFVERETLAQSLFAASREGGAA